VRLRSPILKEEILNKTIVAKNAPDILWKIENVEVSCGL
jgi:hypothetical protein